MFSYDSFPRYSHASFIANSIISSYVSFIFKWYFFSYVHVKFFPKDYSFSDMINLFSHDTFFSHLIHSFSHAIYVHDSNIFTCDSSSHGSIYFHVIYFPCDCFQSFSLMITYYLHSHVKAYDHMRYTRNFSIRDV